MPALRSANVRASQRPCAAAGVLGMCLIVLSLALQAAFSVGKIQPRLVEKILQVNGNLELALSPKVEEAIGKGIPIQIVIDLRLVRQRPIIWDARVQTWGLRRELSYHALSGQYLVGRVSTAPVDRESFTSLSEALGELGTLDGVALTLDEKLDPDAQYLLDVRVRLDVEALPSLLRPVAYTSNDWDLNSEWTRWKVQR